MKLIRMFGVGIIPMLFISCASKKVEKEPEIPAPVIQKVDLLDYKFEMVDVITEPITIIGDQANEESAFYDGTTVTLNPYSISKYEITWDLFLKFLPTHRSVLNTNKAGGILPSEYDQKIYPVDTVGYYKAIMFCNRLSVSQGYEVCYYVVNRKGEQVDLYTYEYIDYLYGFNPWVEVVCDTTKNGFRLPTSAEWEFAARGGDQTAPDWNYKYAGSNDADEVAWHTGIADRTTHPVGQKKPNRLGLYDMSGNVHECCEDEYDYNNHKIKAIKGGSHSDSWGRRQSAVSEKDGMIPIFNGDGRFGFRVVRSLQ